MNKEFIPHELSLKLKNIGFDEPCLYYFNKQENNQLWQDLDSGYYRNSIVSRDNLLWGDTYDNGNVSAPLYQQSFDWLLKEHNLYGIVIPTITMHWTFKTMTVVEDMVEVPPYNHVDGSDYGTFEEARLECLKKLIEIVEDGKSGN